ncbi:MAG: branched-chain amino acid ABC transporter permease [Desulfurococcales archaeon]|nr:branched-chain amino acid ABC transporter permease [Desulfurococcales archaeon]
MLTARVLVGVVDAGFLVAQLVNALFYSSILFMIASGLSLIFGITRILNLAHGAFYMLGAYIMYTVMTALPGGASAVLGILAAGTIVAVIGLLVEAGLLSRVYGKPEEVQLLLTFALILVLDDLAKLIWGPEYKSLTTLPWGSLAVGDYTIPVYHLVAIAVALASAVGLWLLFSRTTLGKKIRASASYPEVAEALGVDTRRMFIVTFMLGSALAGASGALAGPVLTAYPGMGTEAIVLSFAIIVIGGMGSILGALAGALIVGFTRTVMAIVYPVLEVALIYIVMAIVLLVKPTGLFGGREVERR